MSPRLELFGDIPVSELTTEQRRLLNRLKQTRYRNRHRDKVRAIGRAWYWKNAVRVRKKESERVKRRYREDPGFRRNWKITGHLNKYEVTREQIELFDLVKACPICGLIFPASLLADKKTNSKAPVIDHDHKTGKVRGVICASCNSKLAWFEKNRETTLSYLG